MGYLNRGISNKLDTQDAEHTTLDPRQALEQFVDTLQLSEREQKELIAE